MGLKKYYKYSYYSKQISAIDLEDACRIFASLLRGEEKKYDPNKVVCITTHNCIFSNKKCIICGCGSK